MFRRLRQIWDEATGRRTCHPPPEAVDEAVAADLRAGLGRRWETDRKRYAQLFLCGLPLRVTRDEREFYRVAEECGLVTRAARSTVTPRVRLFPLADKFIATDMLGHTEPDQVFSLMFEQVYLVRNMDVRANDRVLELCLGSGVNSLFAGERAATVTGVDLSARALTFARFNASLNGGAENLELLEGSLFEPVAGRRFDLVLVNPPFELVPEDATFFLHSDGGEDGLDVIRSLLCEVDGHLSPDGRLEMITWSPATPAGPALVPLLRKALPDYHLEIHLLGEEPLPELLARFEESPGYEAWRDRLAARGLDRIQMLFVRAMRGSGSGGELLEPEDEIAACHEIAEAWS